MKLPGWVEPAIFMLIPVGLVGLGFWAGLKVEAGRHAVAAQQHERQRSEQLEKAQLKLRQRLELQREKDKEVINAYLAEINQVDSRYRDLSRDERLQLPRGAVCGTGSKSVPTSANGEPGTAETLATTVVLPERVEADLRQLAKRADEVTAQCRTVIDSVR